MKIYLAGIALNSTESKCRIMPKHKLYSYYYCNKGFKTEWFKADSENDISIFLDSGAFSAFSQGVEIKIDVYIQFIKKNKACIMHYANLDVIGNPEATIKNQTAIEKAGLLPMPCYHYGEDIKYLKYYLKNYKYIALGGMVPISTPVLRSWLDKIFSTYICDAKGVPKAMIHGFGMTSFSLMMRYPWYSVDSTTWSVAGRMGEIIIPKKINKTLNTEEMWRIAVSNRSPHIKRAGKHINTMTEAEKKIIAKYINHKGHTLGESIFSFELDNYELKKNERWSGVSLEDGTKEVEHIIEEGLCNSSVLRDEFNKVYFIELENNKPAHASLFKHNTTRKGFEL